jgi:putative transposase
VSNHVHLLLTPGSAGALFRLMHIFARNYTGLFNGRHGRTGTLWEGRFKACLVYSQRYVLTCSRYIELKPVRIWMVAQPGDSPWLSHGANATGRRDPQLVPHLTYLPLGADGPARAAARRALIVKGLSDHQVGTIHAHLQQQKVLGSDRFQDWVAQRTGLLAGVRPRGGPPAEIKCP